MNPEFLRQITPLEDFLNPSRIVIGEYDKWSGGVLEKLYAPFKAPIFRTDFDTAEMIKYVSNTFLSAKISFFNEIYVICQELGLDSNLISKAVSQDPRVGEYGVYGGQPFDGACLPKDLDAFIGFIKARGLNPQILKATNKINREIAEKCFIKERESS